MIDAFVKAIAQLNDSAIQKTVLASAGAALGVFILLWLVIGYLLGNTALFDIGWLETIIDFLGGLATALLTWFLFPGIVSVLIGLFLEKIARAVEARHYPELPAAQGVTTGEAVVSALRFLAILIALNVFMLLFLIIPPVFPFVFYAVNGYLLGREYFELVSLRRMEPGAARLLRKQRQGGLFFFGVLVAFLLTVPVINLLTPIVATAAMVHMFEGWRRPINGAA